MQKIKDYVIVAASAIEAYHGSKQPISQFSIQKDSEGNDQYGPGIYFSDSISVAKHYGRFIHKVSLRTTKFIKPNQRINRQKIGTLLSKKISPDALSNWHENPSIAREMLREAVLDSDNMHEAIQTVWKDAYELDNDLSCRRFTFAGIDGVIIPERGSIFYLVFNPKVIKILEVNDAKG